MHSLASGVDAAVIAVVSSVVVLPEDWWLEQGVRKVNPSTGTFSELCPVIISFKQVITRGGILDVAVVGNEADAIIRKELNDDSLFLYV